MIGRWVGKGDCYSYDKIVMDCLMKINDDDLHQTLFMCKYKF